MNINNTKIELEITKPLYRRYKLYINDTCHGKLVLECYGGVWNLELMEVVPTGKGYGTIFLSKVLNIENLRAECMTVCPINSGAARFFKRNGFTVSDKWLL